MLVTTSNDLRGWEIQPVRGAVLGLTVRLRNASSTLRAGYESLLGGELKEMTSNPVDSREEVTRRTVAEARSQGADSVVAMRFDTSEVVDTWAEIRAYGIAVVAVPLSEAARDTAARLS